MKDKNKISFEKFPGKPYETPKKDKKGINYVRLFIIVLILIIMLIGSGFLNVWYLNKDVVNGYKTVNVFDGNVAVINNDEVKQLFSEIGFDGYSRETVLMNNTKYDTTYAYKKHDGNLTDWVSVYYDEQRQVRYLSLSLTYLKKDFTKSGMQDDCNAILQNFLRVKTDASSIDNLMLYDYFFIKNEYGIEVSYEVTYESNEIYIMTIICKTT